MRHLLPFRIELRSQPSALMVVGVSLLAILAAFLVSALILQAYGMSSLRDYALVLQETIGHPRGIAEVVRKAIPLLLAGVGLALAFRAQFWNIGAEGQLLAGAVAAAGVALFSPIPAPWLLPCMFVAGFVAGSLWGYLPTLLKVKVGVNEVITTLMMNYMALYIVQWLIYGPWKGKSMRGFAYTDPFPEAAWLPLIPGTRVHWPTLIVGLTLAVGVAFLLSRTRLGYEVRVLGLNPEAARYAGIDGARVTLLVMLISGGAAGLAGVGEVAGIHHKLLGPTQISLGYGYTAIIVAWLARGNALAIILTSLLLGFIFASGDVAKVALRTPAQVVEVLNGLILVFLIGSERLLSHRVRWAPISPPS
ncbi:MAG: ABC transporter permease [Candidatus Entotheonellia bacterium]